MAILHAVGAGKEKGWLAIARLLSFHRSIMILTTWACTNLHTSKVFNFLNNDVNMRSERGGGVTVCSGSSLKQRRTEATE